TATCTGCPARRSRHRGPRPRRFDPATRASAGFPASAAGGGGSLRLRFASAPLRSGAVGALALGPDHPEQPPAFGMRALGSAARGSDVEKHPPCRDGTTPREARGCRAWGGATAPPCWHPFVGRPWPSPFGSSSDLSEPVYRPAIGILASRHLATGVTQAGNGSAHGV